MKSFIIRVKRGSRPARLQSRKSLGEGLNRELDVKDGFEERWFLLISSSYHFYTEVWSMRALCSGFEEQARIAQVAAAVILATSTSTSTLLCFSFSLPPVLLYHTPCLRCVQCMHLLWYSAPWSSVPVLLCSDSCPVCTVCVTLCYSPLLLQHHLCYSAQWSL